MFRILKNAHVVNYILVSAALVAPVLIFTSRNKPDSTEVEAVLVSSSSEQPTSIAFPAAFVLLLSSKLP